MRRAPNHAMRGPDPQPSRAQTANAIARRVARVGVDIRATYVAMDRYRGVVAAVIVAAVCAVPAVGLAAAPGKLTRSELNAKSKAGNKLYAAINAAMTYKSGVLASLCMGAKHSGGGNVRSALTPSRTEPSAHLDKLKLSAKTFRSGLTGWTRALTATETQKKSSWSRRQAGRYSSASPTMRTRSTR